MNRPYMMRDMAMRRMSQMRDGRNPYGSRGGYVTSRDPRRRDRMGRMEDYNYSRGEDYARGKDYEYEGPEYQNRDMAMRRDGHYYPFEITGRMGYEEEMYDPYYQDMMYDYARGRGRDYAGAEMLSNRELMDWSQKLMKDVEEKDKAFFKYENVEKKAKDMGIQFDKFTFDEFYTTVLMMYTDYCKTLGTANMDTYLRLAKDWLCDEDVAMRYSEKLATYYDTIVMGM